MIVDALSDRNLTVHTYDVDLAIIGEHIDRKVLRRMTDDLNEEYPLTYFFDVLNYHDILSEELKKHIDRVGKSIYIRNANL